MRFSFVFIFFLITVVFFSSESEASEELEENFTISLDPGWEYWEETNCRIDIRMKTERIPSMKACNMRLPSPLLITCSTFDENPEAIMVPLTIAVAIAMPVTFPEFLDKLTNAEVTPYFFPVAEENMAALFGDINIPDPELITTMDKITYQMAVFSVINAINNNPNPARNRPKVVKGLVPNLSDRFPASGPSIIRLIAFGTNIKAIWAGVKRKAACK